MKRKRLLFFPKERIVHTDNPLCTMFLSLPMECVPAGGIDRNSHKSCVPGGPLKKNEACYGRVGKGERWWT